MGPGRGPRRPLAAAVAVAATRLVGLTRARGVRGRAPRAAPPPAAPPPRATTSCPGTARTNVSSASALKQALASAHPGETIALAPGTYTRDFTARPSGTARPPRGPHPGASPPRRSGTASAPITLCGSRGAVLAGQTTTEGYTFYL